MKKIVGVIVCMMIFVTFIGAIPPSLTSTMSIDSKSAKIDYSHTILGEFGTKGGCVPCYNAHTALKNIFSNGEHPFYYVTLVAEKNTHASYRAKNELGLTAYPSVFWDGNYRKNIGAISIEAAMDKYDYSIIKCGERTVPDIDLSLNVAWLGAVNNNPENNETVLNLNKIMSWTISEMVVNVTVNNNEASQYNGHLHVYVTDIESSMGWKDNQGNPYTFAFLDYAFNQNLAIGAGETWYGSKNWDGMDYYNGTHAFEYITEDNTMVIASVFDDDTEYTDETTGFRAGVGTDPKTFDIYFGNSNPPPKVFSNVTFMNFAPEEGLEIDTTYYWKVDVWDALGNVIEGEIWNFKTEENLPPNKASNPIPKNGGNTVPVTANLSWTGSDPNEGEPLTYDVYFGVINPPTKKISNTTNEFYDPPGDMDLFQDYYWYIVTWDSQENKAVGDLWSFTTGENNPPDTPTITGRKKGNVGENYWYNFYTIDPEDQDISYRIQWRDGDCIDWTEWLPSGIEISKEHSWDEKGDYFIRCQAKDIYEELSEWAEFPISMPKNKISFNTIIMRLLERFPNLFPMMRLFFQQMELK